MKLLILALTLGLSTPAQAIDANCTRQVPSGIYLCPAESTDWYESYTQLVSSINFLFNTNLVSSYTFTGFIAVENSSVNASGFFGDGAGLTNVTSSIIDGSITSDKIASSAVATAKLQDDSVTESKILNGSVTTNKLGTGLYNTFVAGPLDGAITTSKLGSDSVTAAKILNGSVTTNKMASGAIQAKHYGANSIGSTAVNFDYAGSASEAGPATTALALDANPIGCNNQFPRDTDADGTLVCESIVDADVPDTITITNLSGTNSGDQTFTASGDATASGSTSDLALTIAAGVVTTTKLGSGSVTKEKILDGAVTTLKVGSGSVELKALLFDPATEAELTTHTSVIDAHIDHADTLGELNTQLGGTTLADFGSSIDEGEITAGAVTTTKLGSGSVELKALIFDTATEAELTAHTAVTDAHIDHADSLAELNTQISGTLADFGSSIDEGEITAGAVTTAKLGDGSVTTSKLGPGQHDSYLSKYTLVDDAVTTGKIADGSVTTSKLGPGQHDSYLSKAVDTFVTNKDSHDHDGGDGAAILIGGGFTDGGATISPTSVTDDIILASGNDLTVGGDADFSKDVGIGDANPDARFEVVSDRGGIDPVVLVSSQSGGMFRINPNGHVMVGSNANPVAQFEIQSAANIGETSEVFTISSANVSTHMLTMLGAGEMTIGADITPGGMLEIDPPSTRLSNSFSLLVSSTGNTAPTFGIKANGHMLLADSSVSPALSSCGTPSSQVGNDVAGHFTVGGAGPTTACTLTFTSAWTAIPICVVQTNNVATGATASQATTTVLTMTFAVDATGYRAQYHCIGM